MANAFQWYQPPVLNQLGIRYQNQAFIAPSLFPVVTVPKDVFRYISFDQDIAYRIYDDRMAPRASANEIDIKGVLVPATITDKALKVGIDPKELGQNPDLQLKALKTTLLKDALMQAQENRAATILRSTATYPGGNSTTLSGTGQWSNASSDPKAAILAAKDAMLVPGNTLWMGETVYTALQQNPKVIASIQYSNGGSVDTRDILARYLQVDRIVVGKAFYSTNNMGQTLATARIWGNDAGLIYVNPDAPSGLMQLPTFGAWAVSTEGGKKIWRTYEMLDPSAGTGDGMTWIKVEGTYDLIVQASQLGYLWKAAA
jgi:hypothetical protein